MFICKKAEFEFDNISFALPEDMYLDTANSEVALDGFYLIAPDGSFEIEIGCYNSDHNAYDSLSHLVSEEVGYILTEKIQAICCGGLKGYMCRYYDNTSVNEEYAFDIENGTQYNRMNIFITSKRQGKPCNEVLKQKAVDDILKSIKKVKNKEDI